MAEHVAKVLLLSVKIVGRAFARTLRQEMAEWEVAAKGSRRYAEGSNIASAEIKGLTLREAMEILNIDKLDPELVRKNYQHLFSMNDAAKGGSLYLRSKIFRAKERLDAELTTAV